MVFRKFLKNEQSYSKNTGNKLPLFFEDLKLFSWKFLSRINSLATIRQNLSVKIRENTEKFHLQGPAAQTMGSIQKLNIPFCSLQSTEQIICPSQLCGINICWVTWLFLLWWHAKLKFSRIFQKNPIFSETIAPIDKLQKPTSPIFLRSSRLWTSVFWFDPHNSRKSKKTLQKWPKRPR